MTDHSDRTTMEPNPVLTEPNPYGDGWQWRSTWELEEYFYEQGYELDHVDPIWEYFSKDMKVELADEFLKEGGDCAKELLNEHIGEAVGIITEEHLNPQVDGQMRLATGYDVAENGDTLQEGDYSDYVNLRQAWVLGVRDKLEGNSEYASLSQ